MDNSLLHDLDLEHLVFVEVLALLNITLEELLYVKFTTTKGFLRLLGFSIASTSFPANQTSNMLFRIVMATTLSCLCLQLLILLLKCHVVRILLIILVENGSKLLLLLAVLVNLRLEFTN